MNVWCLKLNSQMCECKSSTYTFYKFSLRVQSCTDMRWFDKTIQNVYLNIQWRKNEWWWSGDDGVLQKFDSFRNYLLHCFIGFPISSRSTCRHRGKHLPIPLTFCLFERYCAAGPAKRWRAAAASHKKNYTKTDISRPTNKKVMYFAILVIRGESIATQQGAGLVGKASIDGKK